MSNYNKLEILNSFKEIGLLKSFVLGFGHVFAMFGATVMVPLLIGFSVSLSLFCAGCGTLIFHFITKRKVPVFLGSSFAFLAPYSLIINSPDIIAKAKNLDISTISFASGGVVCAGLVYILFSLILKFINKDRIDKLFPPVLTGPIILLIGLILSPSAVSNLLSNPHPISIIIGIVPIIIITICGIFLNDFFKFSSIVTAITVSYLLALIITLTGIYPIIDFSILQGKKLFGLPSFSNTPFNFSKGVFAFDVNAIISCIIVCFASIVEHIGDMMAIGEACDENYIKNPGLATTIFSDGCATLFAGILGGPANTTYSENTAVITITKVKDPLVVEIAAFVAILLSFSPFFESLILSIPKSIIGGISFILYGMISSTGLKHMVKNKVDFGNMKNIVIVAIILVSGIGFNAHPITIGALQLSGISCAAIFGILSNVILNFFYNKLNIKQ